MNQENPENHLNLDTVKKIILTGFQNLSGLYSNKSGFIERPGLNHFSPKCYF
jgi:hypothetical protein